MTGFEDSIIAVCRVAVIILFVLLAYPYTLYPALLALLAKWSPRPWAREPFLPKISVLIAAHNEAGVLKAKIQNTLALDYPPDRLEVIIASDGSTDDTDAIAESFAPRVRLVRLAERSGKQVALNRAAEAATGEVFVFTDASVYLDVKAARALMRNFVDPQVGAASSVIRITKRSDSGMASPEPAEKSDAEGRYLDFDIRMRWMESVAYSAVGCCGSCYAARRACFVPFDEGACNDFASALDAVRKGYRAVIEPGAIGYMLPARSIAGEYRRKARTIAGGLDTLRDRRTWPEFPKHWLFWWLLASHKIARWVSPWILLAIGFVTFIGAIVGDRLLLALLCLGLAPLAIGAIGLAIPALRRGPIRFASFALVAWSAALSGWQLFLRRKRQIVWQPTQR